MSNSARNSFTAWRNTPEFVSKYKLVRAEAQGLCNADGFDRGIEPDDLYKTWRHFLLPEKHDRYGHEVTCEVVSCMHIDKCQPGHGPQARRPVRVGKEPWASTFGDSATDMPFDEFRSWYFKKYGRYPGV